MVKAIARVFRWRDILGEYATIREIAAAERINESYVGRVLRLTSPLGAGVRGAWPSRHGTSVGRATRQLMNGRYSLTVVGRAALGHANHAAILLVEPGSLAATFEGYGPLWR